ncbi:predicted protein [Naegleria gruberi]|uniref:Predicted protein n=1 Tax=Naegleria gruberi TaxID=5762 RepID=D2V303_NAEGR|nr:uncharacterized protein NAEGRDRAFT_63179 [Naegleria gruberi]EFC48543.1 predicted protein [Naegleria gruberi]|eukprot:XP_002681287.1 predicted protein [Naegleria gruberi strain NEG-M]
MSKQSVTIQLIDISEFDSNNHYFSLLKRKFTNQQKGKILWLKRRDDIPPEMKGFLPIEFAKEVSIATRFLHDNLPTYKCSKTLLDLHAQLAKEVGFETNIFEYIIANEQVIRNMIILRGREFLKNIPMKCADIDRIADSGKLEFTRNDVHLFNLLLDSQGSQSFLYLDDDLKKDVKILRKIFERYKFCCLDHFNEEFRTNRDIVKEAMVYQPLLYRYIDEKLKFDREIVKLALERDGSILKFVPPKTKFHSDIELASIAIRNNHLAFEFVSPKVKDRLESNYQISLDLYQLKYWNTKEKVLEIWENSQFKLEKEIALAGIKQNCEIYFQLPQDLQQDSNIILKYIVSSGKILNDSLNDWIVLELAKNHDTSLFMLLPDKYRNDFHYNEILIKRNARFLRFLTTEMKNNYLLVMQAVKNDGSTLEYASEELRNDLEICKQAIYNNGAAFKHVGPLQEHNYDLLLLSFISNNQNSVQNLKQAEYDPEIIKLVYQFDPTVTGKKNSKFTKEEWIEFTIRKGYCITFSEELFNARLDFEYFGAKIY